MASPLLGPSLVVAEFEFISSSLDIYKRVRSSLLQWTELGEDGLVNYFRLIAYIVIQHKRIPMADQVLRESRTTNIELSF